MHLSAKTILGSIAAKIDGEWLTFQPTLSRRWRLDVQSELHKIHLECEVRKTPGEYVPAEMPASLAEWHRACAAYEKSLQRRLADCAAVIRNSVIATIVVLTTPRPHLAGSALEISASAFSRFSESIAATCRQEWLDEIAWMRTNRHHTHLPSISTEAAQIADITELAERWASAQLRIDIGKAWHAEESVRSASTSALTSRNSFLVSGVAALIAGISLFMSIGKMSQSGQAINFFQSSRASLSLPVRASQQCLAPAQAQTPHPSTTARTHPSG